MAVERITVTGEGSSIKVLVRTTPTAGVTDADVTAAIAAAVLDDLADVTSTAPSDGEVLTWDAGTSQWVPAAGGGGGGGDVPSSRTLTAGTGLSGGGDLSADRIFDVDYGTTAGTAAEGNDARLSDARTPTAHAASHGDGGSDEVALDGSQITTGTVGTARLGSGTASSTTYLRGDQTWAAVSAADAIPESIIDAKGDLVVGTAADTAARLGVGSNGQVLTADSSEAGGMKWAAAVGDGDVLSLAMLLFNEVDVSGTVGPPLPAGLKIGLVGQTDPAENGWWLSDGSGGLTGTPTAFVDAAHFGLVVEATITVETTEAWGSLAPFVTEPSGTMFPTSWRVATENGVDFVLTPDRQSWAATLHEWGRTYSPAMQDITVNTADATGGVYQLSVADQIVSIDATDGPFTIQLGPHATIPRHCYIEHRLGADVTITNLPGDGDDFEYVLSAGDRILVLPDGAQFKVWMENPVSSSTLAANALGYVAHGSTASTLRPSGFAAIVWVGTVEPDNWVAGDLWENPS